MSPSIEPDRWALPPAAPALAALVAIAVAVPIGYVGGGGDDWHYVEAARCAAAHGYCLPANHWETRWPLVAPMGLVFRFFGDGLLQSMVVPLLYSIAACVLFVDLVARAWGRQAATVAGLTLVTTAAFARVLLLPNVDTVELALVTASVSAAWRAWQGRSRGWAIVAGLCLAFATQAHMTSLAWLPILAMAFPLLSPAARRLVCVAFATFLVAVGTECLAYWLASGDPLLSFHLSAAHTRIASTELPATMDLTRSPLFNPQFIAGWRPEMNIDVHWTLNGLINLLANPQLGPVLLAAAALMWMRRKSLSWQDPAVLLFAAGTVYIGALIYGLAIDPKARIFQPAAAIAAALVGRFVAELWASGERAVAAVLLPTLMAVGMITTANLRYFMGAAGPLAGAWAREHPGEVAVGDETRRFLTFDPTIRALPVFPAGSPSRAIILLTAPCNAAQATLAQASGRWSLTRSRDFGRPNDPLNLCEFVRQP